MRKEIDNIVSEKNEITRELKQAQVSIDDRYETIVDSQNERGELKKAHAISHIWFISQAMRQKELQEDRLKSKISDSQRDLSQVKAKLEDQSISKLWLLIITPTN